MTLINCPECGKEIAEGVKKCQHCGYSLRKKKFPVLILLIGVLVIILGMGIWILSASNWSIDNSLKIVNGNWGCLVEHKWEDATCQHGMLCSNCSMEKGELADHVWQDATCVSPKTCSVCSLTEGESLGHEWKDATCSSPKTCSVCKSIEGKAREHVWIQATCTKPKTCTLCGKKEGTKTNHNIADYQCTKCKETFISSSDVPNILDIINLHYDVNYVGGVDIYMTFNNKSSSKTIKYITLNLEFYNAVGDAIRDEITNKTTSSIYYTGPLKAGKTSEETYWRACFYNSTFAGSVLIKEIEIEYSDGTKLVLDEAIAHYAVKAWR